MATWDVDFVVEKIRDSDKFNFVIESGNGSVYDWGETGDYVYIPNKLFKKKKKLTGKEIKLKLSQTDKN